MGGPARCGDPGIPCLLAFVGVEVVACIFFVKIISL